MTRKEKRLKRKKKTTKKKLKKLWYKGDTNKLYKFFVSNSYSDESWIDPHLVGLYKSDKFFHWSLDPEKEEKERRKRNDN